MVIVLLYPSWNSFLSSCSMLDDDMPSTPSPSGAAAIARDSSGILRTKIQLGRKPSVIMPFYLMKPELPAPAPVTGSTNLLSYYGLDHVWTKFCGAKKLKEELSSFLPHLPGNIDLPGTVDGSGLRALVEKPPITGKEILPLTSASLIGFKLQPGSIPEHLKPAGYGISGEKKRHKRKRERMQQELLADESSSLVAARDESTNQNEAAGCAPQAKRMKRDQQQQGGGSGGGVQSSADERDSTSAAKKKRKKKDKKKKRLDVVGGGGGGSSDTESTALTSSCVPVPLSTASTLHTNIVTSAQQQQQHLASGTDVLSF